MLVFAAAASAMTQTDACSPTAPLDDVRAALPAPNEDALLSVPDFAKGCADAEACACAALRLGWMRAARALLRSGKFGSRLRELAQSRANEAKNFLVRLHPKYPAHIKAVPALLWAQTSETLHVRVRLSRYPGGEYTMRRASPLVVNCTADGLFFSAEGDDVAAFFSTTVRWSAPLLADDCVAAEVDGLVALEARKAAPGWWTRLLGGAPTNRVEYANELEPRVGALRACAADGGCADPRECGRQCAATLEPHKEEAEEIEDADE